MTHQSGRDYENWGLLVIGPDGKTFIAYITPSGESGPATLSGYCNERGDEDHHPDGLRRHAEAHGVPWVDFRSAPETLSQASLPLVELGPHRPERIHPFAKVPTEIYMTVAAALGARVSGPTLSLDSSCFMRTPETTERLARAFFRGDERGVGEAMMRADSEDRTDTGYHFEREAVHPDLTALLEQHDRALSDARALKAEAQTHEESWRSGGYKDHERFCEHLARSGRAEAERTVAGIIAYELKLSELGNFTPEETFGRVRDQLEAFFPPFEARRERGAITDESHAHIFAEMDQLERAYETIFGERPRSAMRPTRSADEDHSPSP